MNVYTSQRYMLDLIIPLYESTASQESYDNVQQQQLNTLATAWACGLGYDDCIEMAVNLYAKWMKDPDDISIINPNIKKTVYCTAIAEGGGKDWEFAWSKYLEAESSFERGKLLEAMGCTRNTEILHRYLEKAFTKGSRIKQMDALVVFYSVAKNVVGRDVAWNFLRQNGRSIYEQ
ncbi:hypothetical protein SK128_000550 [Halocaridina rubra]|uniref:ERAP1-like C-terminal domain-containing protein n=1 Tax=Halocaridina rubra TaxID=373956 RepID=A0AAN8WMI7_HALRR